MFKPRVFIKICQHLEIPIPWQHLYISIPCGARQCRMAGRRYARVPWTVSPTASGCGPRSTSCWPSQPARGIPDPQVFTNRIKVLINLIENIHGPSVQIGRRQIFRTSKIFIDGIEDICRQQPTANRPEPINWWPIDRRQYSWTSSTCANRWIHDTCVSSNINKCLWISINMTCAKRPTTA